ncbi:hypothetical protein PMAYCL1PPCAC_31509, partial [Pristionchus mayeri]
LHQAKRNEGSDRTDELALNHRHSLRSAVLRAPQCSLRLRYAHAQGDIHGSRAGDHHRVPSEWHHLLWLLQLEAPRDQKGTRVGFVYFKLHHYESSKNGTISLIDRSGEY